MAAHSGRACWLSRWRGMAWRCAGPEPEPPPCRKGSRTRGKAPRSARVLACWLFFMLAITMPSRSEKSIFILHYFTCGYCIPSGLGYCRACQNTEYQMTWVDFAHTAAGLAARKRAASLASIVAIHSWTCLVSSTEKTPTTTAHTVTSVNAVSSGNTKITAPCKL